MVVVVDVLEELDTEVILGARERAGLAGTAGLAAEVEPWSPLMEAGLGTGFGGLAGLTPVNRCIGAAPSERAPVIGIGEAEPGGFGNARGGLTRFGGTAGADWEVRGLAGGTGTCLTGGIRPASG